MGEKNFSCFSTRLEEERQLIGMTQNRLAQACEVSIRTVSSWVNGKSAPDASALSTMSKLGMDVLYMLTGQRTPGVSGLDQREEALLENYRASDEKGRRVIEGTALLAAERKAG